jgi:hypothetical protein
MRVKQCAGTVIEKAGNTQRVINAKAKKDASVPTSSTLSAPPDALGFQTIGRGVTDERVLEVV